MMDDSIYAAVQNALSSNAQTLSLSSLDLDEIPSDIFSEELREARILEFNVDYNDLLEIPKAIGKLNYLEEFSAAGNRLKSLPKELSRLAGLKKLILNENELETLPVEFSKLCKLKILNLTGNRMTRWHAEFCESFSSLTELYLDENKLCSFPESFGLMKTLRVLEVCDNELSSLPESFGSLNQLETLNLSRNKIKELPNSFGKLDNLKSVDVSDNSLENLPENFNSASTLQYFYADNNMLRTLPSWFESLPQLIRLGLSDNALYEDPLPAKFGHTSGKTLHFLDLAGNSIMKLPDSIGELKVLEILHLGSTINELERRNFQNGNWLSTLPENFGWMTKISKLHLDENQLIELPESFPCLENLEWLDLGQNNLEVLPDSFGNLARLWYLQLSKNHLCYLPESFGNLAKLTDLRLDNNNLTNLPESFSKLSELQTLDLFNNRLSKIPKVLLQLKKLIRLDLDQNDLKMKANKVPKLTGAQLQYPKRDPALKDNWRGRIRADKAGHDPIDVKGIDCLEEISSGGEDDDEDGEEVVFNENALRDAMKKGLSIWKSHTGPEKREVDEREEMLPPVIYQPPLPISSFDGDVFDDADESDAKRIAADNNEHMNDSNIDEKNMLDEYEDWDKEIEQSLHPYPVTKKNHPDYSRVTLINELQQLICSYPPATQALTESAAYKSVVFNNLGQPVSNSSSVVIASEEGQFDDADF